MEFALVVEALRQPLHHRVEAANPRSEARRETHPAVETVAGEAVESGSHEGQCQANQPKQSAGH